MLEEHRRPRDGVYETRLHVPCGGHASPEAWPEVVFDVSSFFPAER